MSRIAALVSTLQGSVDGLGGISPVPVPPDAVFPYITVEEIADKELESLTGPSGKTHTIMQVSCWAKDYETAWDTREEVKTLLFSTRGVVGDQYIADVTYNTGREFYDDQRSLHKLISRFFIWFGDDDSH